MRNHAMALLALLLVPPVMASSVQDAIDKDELAFMADEAPAMRSAFERAQATLAEFTAALRAASPTHENFAIKVGITERDDTEYFWVSDLAVEENGDFVGEIANEPRMVSTVRYGQPYTVPARLVVDWYYIDRSGPRMVGNHTLCALLTRESPEDAAAVIARFNADCSWLGSDDPAIAAPAPAAPEEESEARD